MKLRLQYKRELAEGTTLFGFTADGPLSYTPGQYIRLKLALRYPDSKGDERYFSIVNPDAEKIEIATRISDSGYKQTLAAMQINDEAWISQIGGSFQLPDAATADKRIVMIAGGIGITPFKCMVEHAVTQADRRSILLLYSNQHIDKTAFYEELKKVDAEHENISVVFVMSRQEDWPGPKGRINAELLKKTLPDPDSPYYMVAGPPNFVKGIDAALKDIGATDTHFERFFGAG